MKIYLLEIVIYDPNLPGERTLRFGTGSYRDGDNYYAPRIKNPGSLKQSMFSSKHTGGASQVGYGEIVLSNHDGIYDYLVDCGFGRAVTMKEVTKNGIATVYVCTTEQPTFTWNEISIRIKDKQADLNVPLQSVKYAGTNALPAGVEGTDDIKGMPKPICLGSCFSITPVRVNTSKRIYQVNDGAVYSIAVHDNGNSTSTGGYAFGSDYATALLLAAATTSAGEYDTCLAEGYFRLGDSSDGLVTCDVVQGATAADRTSAQLIKQLALRVLSASDIVNQGFIELDSANSAEVGLYVKSEITLNAAIDILAQGVGAWYGFNNFSKFDIRRMTTASSNAIMTLDNRKSIAIERVASSDEGRGVPAWRVVLDYKKNYTVQTSNVAAAVTDVTRNFLKEEYRRVSSEDASILTVYPNAPELHFTSQFTDVSDAQDECDRLLALYKVRRDILDIRVKPSALRYPAGGWWDDKSISDMPNGINYHASVVHNGYLYVIGGYQTGTGAVDSVIRLDLTNPTGPWDTTTVTALPSARYHSSAVLFGNYLYVMGGTLADNSLTSSVIRLDLTSPSGAWDDAGVTDLPAARSEHSSVVFGNYVYIFGGVLAGPVATASVIRLDLTTPSGSWDDAGVTDLPSARNFHTSVVYGNYVYIVGVAGGSAIRLDLTTPSGAWDDAGVTDYPSLVQMHSAAVLGDYLYVMGGYDGLEMDEVYRLNLRYPSGSWDIAPASLPTARFAHAAVVYNGNIYLVGGYTYETQPNTYVLRTNENPYDVARLTDFGNAIELNIDRFGYGTSKYMRLIGTDKDYSRGDITLTLWG